ncbi:MAG: hypothetical protein ACOY4K_06565 [Pseudomonadota bacterium]
MASVYWDPALGGDGTTTTDDADPTTGLDNYGYTERLVPAFSNVVNIANYAKGRATAAALSETNAAASAASALGAPGTNATSTTSLTVGTGSKSLTLAQTGKAYAIGQVVVIASTASPGNQMTGIITAFTAGTGAMTVDVQQALGSGTIASWTISLGALVSSTLPSQTGNNGKFLTTNGTSAIWADALTPSGNLSGLANAATARGNLGLTIGTHVQAFHANHTAFAGLSLIADRLPYANGTGTLALTTFTAYARTLLDDADQATAQATLGLVPGTHVLAYVAKTAAFGALTGAADKIAYFTGASTLAVTDFSAWGRTLIDDANAAAGRLTLGAAASGANTDITSLGGLTTPLSVSQGGFGGTDAAGIRTAAEISRGSVSGIPTSYLLTGVGYATLAGTVLTDRFSYGYSIVRNGSTGDFTITLDQASASANDWAAVITCGHGTLNVSAMDVTKTASTLNFKCRNGGNNAEDPTALNIMIFQAA